MHRSRHFAQYACALLAVSEVLTTTAAIAESVVVTTVNGQSIEGELISWTPDRIEISAEGNPMAFATAELLRIHGEREPAAGNKFAPSVELADESQLPITDFIVKDRRATLQTPLSEEPIKLPADQVRLVKWIDAEVSLPFPEATGDALAVLKKDSAETEILTGIIGDVSAEQIEFTWEGETLPVKRSKVAAMSFFQKSGDSPAPDPLCYLKLTSGARLAVKQLQLVGDRLQVTTLTGFKLKVPRTDLIEADYSAGKLSYLSDLKPLRSKWTPLIEMPSAAESIRNFGAPRMNISFTGSPLTLSWPGKDGAAGTLQTYNKGLAVRSRTELEYRLPKGMRRFVAMAGIDPETLSQGNVLLQIEADGEPIFERTISGSEPPVEIDANISDNQRLRIFVDYGANLDLGDRLHLVEARLVK